MIRRGRAALVLAGCAVMVWCGVTLKPKTSFDRGAQILGVLLFGLGIPVAALELLVPSRMQDWRDFLARRRRELRASRIRGLGGIEIIPAEERLVLVEIADLFLDTETDPESTGLLLAASPFEWRELDGMLRDDLAPALCGNFLSVAGVWAGWPREWLLEEVLLKRGDWIRKVPPLRWARGFLTTRVVASDWRKVQKVFARERDSGGDRKPGAGRPAS